MAKKAPQFEAIGLPLRQRHYTALTWDDRFQQLVEFGRVNRHFNVPNPGKQFSGVVGVSHNNAMQGLLCVYPCIVLLTIDILLKIAYPCPSSLFD